jgi:CHC2 zinc finger
VRGHDAGDFTDDGNALPPLNMGSYITFSRPEIEAYYAARVPKLRFRPAGESRGSCPIHSGEDDNFAVNLETGEWYCHSQCQRGGDIIELEMVLTQLDFPSCKAEVFRVVGRNNLGVYSGSGLGKERKQNSLTSPSPQLSADFQEGESQLPAAKVREKLAKMGFHPVAEFQYGPFLRKVRFEHETQKQDDKNRAEKTFRWEHCAEGIWYSGDGVSRNHSTLISSSAGRTR